MEPKIVDFPGKEVVGIGSAFSQDDVAEVPHEGGIPALWTKFVARCKEIGLPHDLAFGVCVENHPDVPKAPDKKFVYVAAVPKTKEVPPGMVTVKLPAGKYAVFTHRGSIKDFPSTVRYIWTKWMPEHRDIYREAPDFELYDERFDPVSASGEVDVYIPVKN
jgi:AraC family transcriptional regulator